MGLHVAHACVVCVRLQRDPGAFMFARRLLVQVSVVGGAGLLSATSSGEASVPEPSVGTAGGPTYSVTEEETLVTGQGILKRTP